MIHPDILDLLSPSTLSLILAEIEQEISEDSPANISDSYRLIKQFLIDMVGSSLASEMIYQSSLDLPS